MITALWIVIVFLSIAATAVLAFRFGTLLGICSALAICYFLYEEDNENPTNAELTAKIHEIWINGAYKSDEVRYHFNKSKRTK